MRLRSLQNCPAATRTETSYAPTRNRRHCSLRVVDDAPCRDCSKPAARSDARAGGCADRYPGGSAPLRTFHSLANGHRWYVDHGMETPLAGRIGRPKLRKNEIEALTKGSALRGRPNRCQPVPWHKLRRFKCQRFHCQRMRACETGPRLPAIMVLLSRSGSSYLSGFVSQRSYLAA